MEETAQRETHGTFRHCPKILAQKSTRSNETREGNENIMNVDSQTEDAPPTQEDSLLSGLQNEYCFPVLHNNPERLSRTEEP